MKDRVGAWLNAEETKGFLRPALFLLFVLHPLIILLVGGAIASVLPWGWKPLGYLVVALLIGPALGVLLPWSWERGD